MKSPRGLLLLFLSVVIASTSSSEGATARNTRGKKKLQLKETKEVNICDIEDRQAPVDCYCDNSALRNASNVSCVVSNKFQIDDPIWTYFRSQINLEKLTFTVKVTGSLDYVPSQFLQQLKKLRIIMFRYAKIDELPEYAFSNLSSLTEIHLSKNMIATLRKYAFENMRELVVINLDENRISEINRDIFVNLPSLKRLYLNRNNITTVHDKAFKHLTNLHELELSGNQIAVVTRDSFHGLRSLKRLVLHNNQISMIGDRSFVEMPQLQELELDQNYIEFVSQKALEGMRNLGKLLLSENKLLSLEANFLLGAPAVYFLDLRNNNLRTVTLNNVKPILGNLYNSSSYFYLDGNKLICDCNLAWIWSLRNETKNIKLRDALEELTCFLESNNSLKANNNNNNNNEEFERNQALEIARNHGGTLFVENSREDNVQNDREHNADDKDTYSSGVFDEFDNDFVEGDEDSDANSQQKVQIVEGKVCYVKHLFELKPEELPCPEEKTREDLMASEQPSSRHGVIFDTAGSIILLSSSATLPCVKVDRSVLTLSFAFLTFFLYT